MKDESHCGPSRKYDPVATSFSLFLLSFPPATLQLHSFFAHVHPMQGCLLLFYQQMTNCSCSLEVQTSMVAVVGLKKIDESEKINTQPT